VPLRVREASELVFPLNLPNALTLLRILAVPVVVVALLGETSWLPPSSPWRR
jgi:phosphatidylglycerophosphate synthase